MLFEQFSNTLTYLIKNITIEMFSWGNVEEKEATGMTDKYIDIYCNPLIDIGNNHKIERKT